jgi:hypothetical protein
MHSEHRDTYLIEKLQITLDEHALVHARHAGEPALAQRRFERSGHDEQLPSGRRAPAGRGQLHAQAKHQRGRRGQCSSEARLSCRSQHLRERRGCGWQRRYGCTRRQAASGGRCLVAKRVRRQLGVERREDGGARDVPSELAESTSGGTTSSKPLE